MIGTLTALGARLLPARAALGKVPRWAWIALLVVLAAAAGTIWLDRKVSAAIAAAETRGEARADARWTKATEDLRQKALALARKADAKAAAINRKLKDAHDEEVRNIAAVADDLRLRGPGAAAPARCGPGDAAGVSGGAGEHGAAGRPGDAALAGLPDPLRVEFITVPFAGAVGFAEQHDAFRAEALTWRSWHARFLAEFEEYRRQLQAAAQAKGTKGTPNAR